MRPALGSPELERMTREWLAAHDPEHRPRRVDPGPPVEWQLAPVSSPDCDDEDAAEIAATFADLSGGRLVSALGAWCARQDARGEERRSYMREVRHVDPVRAQKWREAERRMRSDPVRGERLRERDRARKREERRRARVVRDLFASTVRGG